MGNDEKTAGAVATEQEVRNPVADSNGADTVKAARFSELNAGSGERSGNAFGRVLNVSVAVSVELGRAQVQIHDIVALSVGSVIELEKKAGEPVDLVLNGKVLAKGEVVVVDENFGIRITKIEDPEVRIQSLG